RSTRLSIVASTRPSTTRVSQSRISAPLSLTSGPTIRRLSLVASEALTGAGLSVAAVSGLLDTSVDAAGLPALTGSAAARTLLVVPELPVGRGVVRVTGVSAVLWNRLDLLNMLSP